MVVPLAVSRNGSAPLLPEGKMTCRRTARYCRLMVKLFTDSFRPRVNRAFDDCLLLSMALALRAFHELVVFRPRTPSGERFSDRSPSTNEGRRQFDLVRASAAQSDAIVAPDVTMRLGSVRLRDALELIQEAAAQLRRLPALGGVKQCGSIRGDGKRRAGIERHRLRRRKLDSEPAHGRRPESASNRQQPNDQMSVLLSSGWQRACSGLM